jgi:predicted DNA-binding transcriptional regulator AlpA
MTKKTTKRQQPFIDPARSWLRSAELAQFLNVSRMTVWRFRNDPALGFPKPAHIGGIVFFERAAIEAWLRLHRVPA